MYHKPGSPHDPMLGPLLYTPHQTSIVLLVIASNQPLLQYVDVRGYLWYTDYFSLRKVNSSQGYSCCNRCSIHSLLEKTINGKYHHATTWIIAQVTYIYQLPKGYQIGQSDSGSFRLCLDWSIRYNPSNNLFSDN